MLTPIEQLTRVTFVYLGSLITEDGRSEKEIKKSLLSRLHAFEMWVYRRVLKISWTEKITNEAVLRRVGTGRERVR